MSSRDLKGKWFKPDPKNPGDFISIDVIEVTGEIARAIGKNIPIDELIKNWLPASEMAPDPFKIPGKSLKDVVPQDVIDPKKLGAIDNEQLIDDVLETQSKPIAQNIVGDFFDQHSGPKSSFEPKLDEAISVNPEFNFIKNAIKLSKAESKVSLAITHVFNCDISKLKLISNSMDIDPAITASALMSDIRSNPESFFKAIEEAIVYVLKDSDDQIFEKE